MQENGLESTGAVFPVIMRHKQFSSWITLLVVYFIYLFFNRACNVIARDVAVWFMQGDVGVLLIPKDSHIQNPKLDIMASMYTLLLQAPCSVTITTHHTATDEL